MPDPCGDGGEGRPHRPDGDHRLDQIRTAVGQPPSFDAAFGSKAGFFDQMLKRYAASVLSLDARSQP
ncbi:hypothetical protein [Novosphingobium rosa]|uniref:hypothetical protein n=1 Tax=Novosphingobium rosa TaxID=76978 RepID=UPI0008362E8E|nr:hypothetical protein [Novosphingobium rosa]